MNRGWRWPGAVGAVALAWVIGSGGSQAQAPASDVRLGLVNVNAHAWWFGGYFNPYDEARLERNFARAAIRNRTVKDVPLPLGGATIVAVWDADPARAQEFAATFRVPRVAARLEELAEGIDAVLIVDAEGDGADHLRLATPFLERGLPAFVDKPFAHTARDAQAIVDLAERHRAPVFTASTLPHVVRRRWGARLEAAGPPSTVFSAGPRAHAGGAIHNIIINHHLLGGRIDAVRNTGDERRDVIHLLTTDGRLGLVYTSEDLRIDEQPEFHVGLIGRHATLASGPIVPMDFQYGAAAFMRQFVEMVGARRPPTPYAEIVEQVRIFEAARISKARGGAIVSLAEIR